MIEVRRVVELGQDTHTAHPVGGYAVFEADVVDE